MSADYDQILFLLSEPVFKVYIGAAAFMVGGAGKSWYLCIAGAVALLYTLLFEF